MCRRVGLDVAADRIPVGPAAHYLMGGIDTDTWGRTSIAGLFAAGEAACTGVHGANRLASNSLLEGLVFGARAAVAMCEPPFAAPLQDDRQETSPADSMPPGRRGRSGRFRARRDSQERGTNLVEAAPLDVAAIRDLMWRSVGLFRTGDDLKSAVAQLDAAFDAESRDVRREPANEGWRRFNMVTVARLIARAALRREESRGAHFREDFPARDDERWKVHVIDRLPVAASATGGGATIKGH
jgi:L-aspartate oxidase